MTTDCHLLGHHPEQQRRVQQEADTVLGGRSLTAEDANKLPDTTAAIKEAMRLYPPVPALGRLTPTGDQIGGYPIPPGAIVVLSPWVTHRRPDFWPDPHRFNPDRFHPTATAGRHSHAYVPFAAGPRGCIGEHFAMAEAIVATAALLNAYTLETTPGPVALKGWHHIAARRPTPVPAHAPVRLTPGGAAAAGATPRHLRPFSGSRGLCSKVAVSALKAAWTGRPARTMHRAAGLI